MTARTPSEVVQAFRPAHAQAGMNADPPRAGETDEPAVRLDHVSKQFNGRTVLDDLSFEIRAGRSFCLLGRSGTGKSVTLRHIIRLVQPDRGQVFVEGRRSRR